MGLADKLDKFGKVVETREVWVGVLPNGKLHSTAGGVPYVYPLREYVGGGTPRRMTMLLVDSEKVVATGELIGIHRSGQFWEVVLDVRGGTKLYVIHPEEMDLAQEALRGCKTVKVLRGAASELHRLEVVADEDGTSDDAYDAARR
jgi:hypothetical protein